MALDGVGYSKTFDNISISSQETVNDIESVMVSPLPYRFLMRMKIVGTENNLKNKTKSTNPTTVLHSYPYHYVIGLADINSDMLVLHQSYDEGWEAYTLSKPPGFWASTFPWFFGTRLEKHVLVNNWANGWELPVKNSKLRIENLELKNKNLEDGKQHIVIIFWPQYLEFVGFGLLVITILAIMLPRSKRSDF